MKITTLSKWLVCACVGLIAHTAAATDVLVWDKKPLEVRLEVGKERLIEFPDNILFGLPTKLTTRLKLDSAAGVAYLTPLTTFPKTRVPVKLATTNEIIFIDLFAAEADGDAPMDLVKIISNKERKETEQKEQARFEESGSISLKDLVQYASHDYFAPPRLRQEALSMQISEVTTPLDLRLLFGGESAGLFDLKPLRQYRTLDYTLTAIMVTNRSDSPQNIVFSDIKADYVTVSSQHLSVGPKSSSTQSTMLYFVTNQPLSEMSSFTM